MHPQIRRILGEMSREKWLWKIAGRKESGQIIEYSLDAMRFFLLITGVGLCAAEECGVYVSNAAYVARPDGGALNLPAVAHRV